MAVAADIKVGKRRRSAQMVGDVQDIEAEILGPARRFLHPRLRLGGVQAESEPEVFDHHTIVGADADGRFDAGRGRAILLAHAPHRGRSPVKQRSHRPIRPVVRVTPTGRFNFSP